MATQAPAVSEAPLRRTGTFWVLKEHLRLNKMHRHVPFYVNITF